ncbi:MAG: anhydro-N-acetylmuramic acid kinase [Balneolales bacterium]
MNPSLKKLQHISLKKERFIIGLMSGTSMDGLDIALCRFSGSGVAISFEIKQFESMAYTQDTYQQLVAFETAECLDALHLCIWHTHLANLQAGMINEVLKKWNISSSEIDLIASHGQTLYHAPKHQHQIKGMPHATLQIGDGDHIAAQTGIITISDFRQRDTARGNEGAPLAAYGDFLLFGNPVRHLVLLNIGGIANFTWLPAGRDTFPPLSFDTGPGNTLIDAATRMYFQGLRFDSKGGLAARGTINRPLLDKLKRHPYFKQPAPKTTGFETFNLKWVERCMAENSLELHAEDLLATLTQLTVDTIADEILQVVPDDEPVEVYVSGGGVYNNMLMKGLSNAIENIPVRTIQTLDINPDAKEALIMAALANELICGEDSRLHLGKISLPDV